MSWAHGAFHSSYESDVITKNNSNCSSWRQWASTNQFHLLAESMAEGCHIATLVSARLVLSRRHVTMPQCSVLGCTNPSNKDVKPNLFRFPKDLKLRKKWIDACKRKNWKPTPNSRICSDHFDEASFKTTHFHLLDPQDRPKHSRTLKIGAVPLLKLSKLPSCQAVDQLARHCTTSQPTAQPIVPISNIVRLLSSKQEVRRRLLVSGTIFQTRQLSRFWGFFWMSLKCSSWCSGFQNYALFHFTNVSFSNRLQFEKKTFAVCAITGVIILRVNLGEIVALEYNRSCH